MGVFLLLSAALVSSPLRADECGHESRLAPEETNLVSVVSPDWTEPAAPPAKGAGGTASLFGNTAPSAQQRVGALTGKIVFMNSGHGWTHDPDFTPPWRLQRGILHEMNEDYGNYDQLNFFASYCFNAGATVVSMRPLGRQTNEVILDNDSAAVTFAGTWSTSSSTLFWGSPGDVAYRYASLSASETATATYTPTIPVAGFYPVYCWTRHGSDRGEQLYRIRHTGGESQIRIPHHMVGNGWIYLGEYYFNFGSNATVGSVVISNLRGSAQGSVVIADAIRFGNGMGTVDQGGGPSGYPREDENMRYWVKANLGQGQSTSLYEGSGDDESDSWSSPPKMSAEMNRQEGGDIYDRVHISFHSNAGVGTSRGTVALITGDPTPHQADLALLAGGEVNDDLVALGVPPLETNWFNKSTHTYTGGYSEIDGSMFNYEMAATIIEVAYHDNAPDALLMRDPKARSAVGKAAMHAVVKFMNQYDTNGAPPLAFLPEAPTNVRALAGTNGQIALTWAVPVALGGSQAPTNYIIYRSTNGFGFGTPVSVGNVTNYTFTNLAANTDLYFRIAAANAGGESMPSEVVGCRAAATNGALRVLVVNSFDRFDRTLNLRHDYAKQNWDPPGNSGAIERVFPRANNSFDYVVAHGKAIAAAGVYFDSCHRTAISGNLVALTNYAVVIWASGAELTNTFSSTLQSRLTNYLNQGRSLFVSGSEIAGNLDRVSGPSAADRAFFNNYLHADLANDTHTNSGSYTFSAAGGSIFAGNGNATFDNGSRGIYWVKSPSVLTPSGTGATAAVNYTGGLGGAAGIQYNGAAGSGKIVYFGFPFETITNATLRADYMADILNFLAPSAPLITAQPQNQTVSPGGTAVFSVTASGAAPLAYQWRKDGMNLSNGGNVSGATATALTLSNVTGADATNYVVVITNAAGSVTSSVATLTINTLPMNWTLNLPPRDANALSGTAFAEMISPLPAPGSSPAREDAVFAQIAQGNIPNFLRQLVAVTTNASIGGTNFTVTYYVTPDYLAVGSDEDYFLMPMTPLLGQRLADLLDCSMPTRKMVNDIWTKATVKLAPSTIPPSPEMITVPVFAQHNTTVRGQRDANGTPLGALVGGDKKDVIISTYIYSNLQPGVPKPVVIYGWHYLDGSNIQPRYNGHEETYADYSHGIRLVKNVVVLNSAASTVAEILAHSTLNALLSDEGAITVPEYPLTPSLPKIVNPPFSQTVRAGSNAVFSAVVYGDLPLAYTWKLNGANISGATDSALTVSAVDAGDVGTYTLTISNSVGSATSIPVWLKLDSTNTVLFSDNFDTNSSARWDLFQGSGNGTPDYTVDWAYDYSTNFYTFNGATYSIPPSPGSTNGISRSVKFTVNNNDTTAATAGVNIYPKNYSFSNNFVLKCDLWMNYPGGAGGINSTGSTEHVLMGINHLGTQPNWRATTAASTDGIWFAADGEGGTTNDYRAFVGNLSGVQTELIGSIASGLSVSNNVAALFTNLFPTARFESVGSPGKNWVAMELMQTNNHLFWKFDGVIVAQRTNTSAFTFGKIMLGYMDVFTSIANPAKDAFVLFDNVRVEDLDDSLQTPAFVSQPQSQTVNEGGEVNFTFSASGTAPLTYQWRKEGVNLSGETGTALTLSNAQSGDAGNYSVVVANGAGAITSTVAMLTVYLPPSIVTSPQSQTLLLGANASFNVTATGTVPLAYQWKFNGTDIGGATDSSYTRLNAQTLDAGDYSVTVTNIAGAATSEEAVLTVQVLPFITTQPQSQTVGAEANVTFTVVAGGTAPLAYQWRKNGVDISGATTTALTLNTVQTNHAGDYSVFITNAAGTLLSSNAVLVVQPENVKPTVSISSPAANATVFSPSLLVQGKATDNKGVAQVKYSLNGGSFVPASGASDWSAALTLAGGTNTVIVQSIDTSGNESLPLTRKFFFSVPSLLTVNINGSGQILNNLNGQNLLVGRSYRLTASVGAGTNFIFTNWTRVADGATNWFSSTNDLRFLMQSNLVLNANFITNPFLKSAGIYSGLFYETDGVKRRSAGFLTLKATTKLGYSGKLLVDGDAVTISGKFNLPGTITQTVLRTKLGKSPLTLEAALDFANGTEQITGTVRDGTNWVADLIADHAIWTTNAGGWPATAFTNTCTLLLPGLADAAEGPVGYSSLSVSVDLLGKIKINGGVLADGTAFKPIAAVVSTNGLWPLFMAMYPEARTVFGKTNKENQGVILGWVDFSDGAPAGTLDWVKTGWTNDFYPGGFTNQSALLSSIYTAPPKGVRAMNWTEGIVNLSEGNLADPIIRAFTFGTNNLLPVLPTNNQVKLTLTTKSGLLKGSFTHPHHPAKATTIHGAVLQEQNFGAGSFLGTNQTGLFLLQGF